LKCVTTIGGRKTEKLFESGDQFAPELIYFSDCIIHDRTPEPSGNEGLADVRIINAIYESAEIGRAVRIEPVPEKRRPDETMEIKRPPVRKPKPVGASAPHLKPAQSVLIALVATGSASHRRVGQGFEYDIAVNLCREALPRESPRVVPLSTKTAH
jgi:hypothetical protein